MKKVIITGATGFIGSWFLKELLKNDINVTAILRHSPKNDNITFPKNTSVVYCELNNFLELKEKIIDRDFDVFYHLAWEGTTGKERSDYSIQLSNIKFACDAAVTAKELGCKKFVSVGTITEKIAENTLNINSKAENLIYGITKHSAHCILEILCRKLGIDFVWAQLSNIYGEGNLTGNLVSYTLGELSKGNRPTYSKAEQPYDFLYIGDAVHALYLIGENKNSVATYYVGSGSPRKLKDYLLSIRDIYGQSAEIGIGERPDDGLTYFKSWFDISSLVKDTGFLPLNSFEQNINRIVENEGNK